MSQAIETSEDTALDVRGDFPSLAQTVNGQPLVYLDSAASAQMPGDVITAVRDYQAHDHANVHRGVHTLSHRATEAYESAREKIQKFVNARESREIVLTSGTTESINLVAQSYARPRSGPGKKILITHLEHHSNIVPWQLLCEQTGAELVVAPIDEHGQVVLDALYELMTDDVIMLGIGHVSNALGTINPVRDIVATAHSRGIVTIVDGAQGVPHLDIDVQALDCDFYAFSGHKMFGPTGIGVLYGKEALLDAMPPYKGGGEMILEVTFDHTTFNELPYKFEAGTPNISGAVGLGAAVDYMLGIGLDRIAAHEQLLLHDLMTRLQDIDGIRLIGTAKDKASVQSFVVDDIHPHDIGTVLDQQGVAVRTGHHCAMPVMDFFGVPGTARASLAVYNTAGDIDRLIAAIHRARELFE